MNLLSLVLATNQTVRGITTVTQSSSATTVTQYEIPGEIQAIIIFLIVFAIGMAFILGIYMYGLGPFRGLAFYRGPLLEDVTPDNGLTFRKMKRLRKQMMSYTRKGTGEVPLRIGMGTGYSTAGGPRIYMRYGPSEMAMQLRLIPWIKKVTAKMKDKWKYTPQSWEQLCLLFYKDYIDQKLNDPTTESTMMTILQDDKQLIEEMETSKLRPYLDDNGKQLFDQDRKPLFHTPHTVDESEALIDRAENAMVSENPEELRVDNVDIKEAVMFRRSTFTDNDLTDAFNEGFAKAKEQFHRDNTRIAVIAMAMFIIMIGAAVLLSSAHII